MTRGRILVVEDESVVAQDIQDMLGRAGYEVPAITCSGEDAIEKAAQILPDLILMDIVLSGRIDGVEAAREIRAQFDIPVIYLTAYVHEPTLERAKVTEPFGYILKPFDGKELQTTIEMALYKFHMERKLKESELKLATTLNSIGDAVIATDTRERITFMNPVAEALTGWKQGEALGRVLTDVFDILDEETGDPVECPASKVLQDKVTISLINSVLRAAHSKKERPIIGTAAPIRNDQALLTGVVLAFQDISERKQAEQQLRLQATALESAASGILITDRQGTINWVNPAFTKLTGYSAEEVLGQTPRILRSGKHDEAFYRDLWSTILSGHVWRGELVNRRKDGSLYTEEQIIAPVCGGRGEITNFVAIKQDVTEQRQLEQQLFQTQKLESLGTLVGGIAHDFNNTLTGILGYTQLLLRQVNPEKSEHELLRRIELLSQRAGEMVKQLLAFSREGMSQKRSLSLHPFLQEVGNLLERMIPEDIDVESDLAAEDLQIEADPTQLQQVLMNLTINARDAMPQGGCLTIQTRVVELDHVFCKAHPDLEPGRYVRLSVADTGSGIPSEIRSRIFDPFFTTKDADGGTGLGLSVVYGIVKKHGGAIEVESEIGRGTIFHIFFQLAARTAAVASASVDPPRHTETILLVEDEPAVLELGRAMLEQFGYRVLTASDGDQAIGVYKTHRSEIALVILDAIMQKLSVSETLQELKRLDPDIEVLLATGYDSSQGAVEELLADGVRGLLRKPFQDHELAQAVQVALSGDPIHVGRG